MPEDTELARKHLTTQKKRLAEALEKGDMVTVAAAAGALAEIHRRLGGEADPDALRMTVASTGGGVVRGQKEQDEAAALFDKLSPGELTRLYLEDRLTWQRIMDAKEEDGMRRLFETN